MPLDASIAVSLNSFAGRSAVFDAVVVFLASYFPWLLAGAFAISVYYAAPAKGEAWHILSLAVAAGLVARFGIAELIRLVWDRPRPYLARIGVRQLFTDTGGSFPSGHAVFFFAIVAAAFFYDPWWGWALFAGFSLVLLARIIAGLHYPSDVIGGALIGAATACAFFLL